MRFFAAAGLVMVLTGLAAFYAIGELSVFSIANLVAGPLLVLGAAIVEARRFRGFTGSRSRRAVLRWVGISTLVLLAVIGLNVLAASWTTAIDLTVHRQYTLSDQTRALCSELEAEVADAAPELLLFEDALLADDVRLLISAYDAGCPIVARELKTADAPPQAALILESFDTTVVACQSDRCEYVGYPSEENITNAILRLVRQEPPVVYFSVGHGEADLASERDHGFTALTEALRNEGIELRAFVSVAHPEVPEDAAVVIAAAPARNFLQSELDALDRYLARGGRLLVLQEPGAQTNLTDLLGRWGFELPDVIAVDRQSSPLLEDPQPISMVDNSF